MPVMKYRDWEEAAKKSKWERAVGTVWIEYRGQPLMAEVVKPLHGDPEIFFYHTHVKIRDAATHEVDAIKEWKPW